MAKATGVNTKVRKPRPEQTGTLVGTRFQPDQLAALDYFAATEPDKPSRPEVVRRLVALGLMAKTSKLTPEEGE